MQKNLNIGQTDVLDEIEQSKIVFTKSTNLKLAIATGVLIICNAVFIFLDHPPKEALQNQKMSETIYHSGMLAGLIILYALIALPLSAILSLIFYRGVSFKEKFVRIFLVTSVTFHLPLFFLFVVTLPK